MVTNGMRLGGLCLIAVLLAADVPLSAQQRPTNPRLRRPTTPPPTKPATKPGSPAPAPSQVSPPKTSPFAPPPIPANTSKSPAPMPPQPRREGEPAPLPTGAAKPVPAADSATKPIAKPNELEIVPIPIGSSQSPSNAPVATTPAPATAAPRTAEAAKPLAPIKPDADGKYLFRYSFSNGETVAWQVEHRAKIVTTVQETTQTAETITLSKKVWKVIETLPGGETKFVHLVAAIDMRQKLTGRQEVRYDSETDAENVPPIFADAAKQVGIPLAEVTIDTRGNLLKRADKQPRPEGSPTNSITVVLPDKPLAVGESWTSPFDLTATDAEGQPKIIKARHKLTLEKIEGDLATLRNDTQILSPIKDPTIEAQVVQAEQSGTVVFDLRRGRIVSQNSDLDKEVFGFQGPESKLHYSAQFHEKLTADPTAKTAAKTK